METRIERMAGYEKRFTEKVRTGDIEISEEKELGGLKIGQKVTFTNDYGVKFSGHKVLAFQCPDRHGRSVFIDIDCFWFPCTLESLTPE